MKYLALTLMAVAACDSGLTTDAQPTVSVLKQDGDCFALMTAGSPVSNTLGVSGTCNYRAEPRLLAGVDLVEVIVDYGQDVEFSGTATAPTPDVNVTVDGVASDVPIEISDELRVGGRAYFIATFHAPSDISNDVRIGADVNSGFGTVVPDVFTTIAPPVSLSLFECPPGSLCELPGAVGSAHIALSVPGQVPQLITIHSLLAGLPQPDPIPPVKTGLAQGRTEAVTAIPVPAAPDFTQWTIRAELGEATPVQVYATIRKPELHTLLSCNSSCSALGTGEMTGLQIIAPSEIRPLEARVDTKINGVPEVIAAPVELVQRADGTATGSLALMTPATTGTWQIDVTVAGYLAPAIVTGIQ
ncbi:MAG TPA: hypothetical protein VLB44_04115 [Kofleriaceae bacterium]|nr:hypothetical protein [Kofleriaceae bacterium]